MRYIFTDFDGVLNPHWRKKWSKSAISVYNKICKDFDLKPVITSTWRLNHTIDELQKIFTEQGIEPTIFDYTPHLDQQDRGLEISEWLKNNKCEFYIVVDDVVSNIEPYVNNVFKTMSYEGVTEETYEEIKLLINKK